MSNVNPRKTFLVLQEEMHDNLCEFFREAPVDVNPFDEGAVANWFADRGFDITCAWIRENPKKFAEFMTFGAYIQDEEDDRVLTFFSPMDEDEEISSLLEFDDQQEDDYL